MDKEDKIYSISEIYNILYSLPSDVEEQIIPPKFLDSFRISGTIKSIRDYKGHKYIILIDNDNSNKMTCFCNKSLQNIILQVQENKNITFKGALIFKYLNYNCTYELQFIIKDIIEKEEKESKINKLINKCKELNLFDNKKYIEWDNVKNIALLSKKETHGYNDFMHNILKIKDYINITLFEFILEGENTEKSLIENINKINNDKNNKYDVIIICRGGGATENISLSYDKLELFKCIKNSNIPVCSAIGHSDDKDNKLLITNITDYNFTTPTEAGNFIYHNFITLIDIKLNKLENSIKLFKEIVLLKINDEIDIYISKINHIKDYLINKYNYITIENNKNNIIIYNGKRYKLDIKLLDEITRPDNNLKINEIVNTKLNNKIDNFMITIDKEFLNSIKSNKKLYNYCLELYEYYYKNNEIYELYNIHNDIKTSGKSTSLKEINPLETNLEIFNTLEKYNFITNEIININNEIKKYKEILNNIK